MIRLKSDVLPAVGSASERNSAACLEGSLRQPMRLHSLEALQAMLDGAQQSVGRAQLAKLSVANVSLVMQLLQGDQRPTGAQPWLASAMHALQTLHQKLNFAQASRPILHVHTGVALADNAAPDSFEGTGRGLDGREAERLAIDQLLNLLHELPRQHAVAGAMAQLQ